MLLLTMCGSQTFPKALAIVFVPESLGDRDMSGLGRAPLEILE